MINRISDAISKKIYDTFGEEYSIYDSTVNQNFDVRGFYIKPITPELIKDRGKLYRRINSFDIIYFPDESDDMGTIYAVGERLFNGLEYIMPENDVIFRGVEMRYEVTDGVLHFFVNYNRFYRYEDYSEKMEIMTQKKGIQNE